MNNDFVNVAIDHVRKKYYWGHQIFEAVDLKDETTFPKSWNLDKDFLVIRKGDNGYFLDIAKYCEALDTNGKHVLQFTSGHYLKIDGDEYEGVFNLVLNDVVAYKLVEEITLERYFRRA